MDSALNVSAEPKKLDLPEESAQELYEDAPCGYLSLLPDGTIVRANRTFLAWTGYQAENLLSGTRLQDLLPLPAKVFYETHYAPLLRMQGFIREMAMELVCANKQVLPVLVNATEQRDASGSPVVIRTVIYDATERRRYERELLAARRRLEPLAAVVEASGDAIILTSPSGSVLAWNRGAERMFGYTAAEAVGHSVVDLILPQGREGDYARAVEQVRNGGEIQLETSLAHKAGHSIDVSLSLTQHIEAPGEVVAISSIIRDITQHRLVEKQTRQADKLQSVGTLAGGVAHEVNNQMTVVLGFGQFVLKALGPDHPQASDVQCMIAAAERAARISQQLLAFSRQQLIVPENFDLGRLVGKLRPALEQELEEEHSLLIDVEASEAPVSADPAQVERILLHLVRNARAAMGSGGQLRISVQRSTLTDEDARLHPGEQVEPGAYVLVTVTDTGVGMDEETLRRAFDPFFTTRPFGEGSGLGLPTVHGLVKQHGGQVWATSQPGRGTTVYVYLPLNDSSVEPDPILTR
jgi:PAS domain S-box-containing protein